MQFVQHPPYRYAARNSHSYRYYKKHHARTVDTNKHRLPQLCQGCKHGRKEQQQQGIPPNKEHCRQQLCAPLLQNAVNTEDKAHRQINKKYATDLSILTGKNDSTVIGKSAHNDGRKKRVNRTPHNLTAAPPRKYSAQGSETIPTYHNRPYNRATATRRPSGPICPQYAIP